MCLAVPGQIISIDSEDALTRSAQVSFGGAIREASLVFVPEAKRGDYVIVHAGIAISVLDEAAAQQVFRDLEALE